MASLLNVKNVLFGVWDLFRDMVVRLNGPQRTPPKTCPAALNITRVDCTSATWHRDDVSRFILEKLFDNIE